MFILLWRPIKVTQAILKSCVFVTNEPVFLFQIVIPPLVCCFKSVYSSFRLEGSFQRQQVVELPSREAIGCTPRAASVIADETRLHFSRSGLSPLLAR